MLVKVHAVPLCTEYKGWLSGKEYQGHEAAGEVVEVAQPGKVKVGDRVVVMPGAPCGKCALCISGEYIHCQHWYDHHEFSGLAHEGDTHVQYLIKQDWLLAPIPDGMSYELASLACCGLGPTFGAMENMNVSASDTVLITGAGPVGLGGVVNAKYRARDHDCRGEQFPTASKKLWSWALIWFWIRTTRKSVRRSCSTLDPWA